MHTVTELTTQLGANPQSASLLRRGTENPDDLSEDEWFQFSNLAHSIMNNFQTYHWLRQRGLLNDSAWIPTVNNLRAQMSLLGFRAW